MLENRIDATLSPSDAQAVLDAVTLIRQKLPFLLEVSEEEALSRPRLGESSRAFAQKALEVAEAHPDLLPRSFEIDAMRRDWELFQSLAPLEVAISQLHQLIDDALALSGSEVMLAAMLVYRLAQSTHGYEETAHELEITFARRNQRQPAA